MFNSTAGSPQKTCVVLRTHIIDDHIYLNSYLPLKNSLPEQYHLLVVHDQTNNPWNTEQYPISDILFIDEDLMRLHNPLHKDNWYTFESFLSFLYPQHSNFDNYWVLEYDVRYSGSWSQFFSRQDLDCSADALLISGAWPFNGDESWWVWHELNWATTKPVSERYAGYLFLGRYSNRLLECLHNKIGESSGYAEVYLATFCNEFGFNVESIDKTLHGTTCATNAGISELTYLIRRQEEPNKIFHKVLEIQGD